MSDPIDPNVKPAFGPVRTSSRGWAEENTIAEASDVMDYARQGVVAVANAQPPVIYEFSNGRRFRSKRDPYA